MAAFQAGELVDVSNVGEATALRNVELDRIAGAVVGLRFGYTNNCIGYDMGIGG